jgi:hypothetical protein
VDEFVPEESTKFYFAAADAVVLPYEANFSRGSGVLIECCRHLRPMIASATPYFSAFLARYQCGVNYAPGNSVSFAVGPNACWPMLPAIALPWKKPGAICHGPRRPDNTSNSTKPVGLKLGLLLRCDGKPSRRAQYAILRSDRQRIPELAVDNGLDASKTARVLRENGRLRVWG